MRGLLGARGKAKSEAQAGQLAAFEGRNSGLALEVACFQGQPLLMPADRLGLTLLSLPYHTGWLPWPTKDSASPPSAGPALFISI
jgi:hypothetical protein